MRTKGRLLVGTTWRALEGITLSEISPSFCVSHTTGFPPMCLTAVHTHADINSFLSPTTNLWSRHSDYPHFAGEESKSLCFSKVTHAAVNGKSQGSRPSSVASNPILSQSATAASCGPWMYLHLPFRVSSYLSFPGHWHSGCHCFLLFLVYLPQKVGQFELKPWEVVLEKGISKGYSWDEIESQVSWVSVQDSI